MESNHFYHNKTPGFTRGKPLKKRSAAGGIPLSFLCISLLVSSFLHGQTERFELLPFGDMNQWASRKVNESFIIGGNTVTLYEITDSTQTTPDDTPYKDSISPWATSDVYAKVDGIRKASATVYPVKRKQGFVAELTTKIESVKVFGIVNIHVLACGTIFLGHVIEPIRGKNDPQRNILSGYPFTKRPDSLQFDYKVITGGPARQVKGLKKKGRLTGKKDYAKLRVFLQKRWEDAEGNIYAKRVGTGFKDFHHPVLQWQNHYRVPIYYGNITHRGFSPDKTNLNTGKDAFYARNKEGQIKPIEEIGWADPGTTPNYLILYFSSSSGGSTFTGNTHSRLWIDNVGFVYSQKNNTPPTTSPKTHPKKDTSSSAVNAQNTDSLRKK